MSAPVDVNEWTKAEHAGGYLSMGQDWPPHRGEGEAVLLAELPAEVTRVLDLGSGDGRLLDVVLAARPGAAGVATDFSPAMLDAARRRFADRPEVEVVAHDLSSPLPARITEAGPFDAVVSSFAIHHLTDHGQARALQRGVRAAAAGWAVRELRARGCADAPAARPLLRVARRGRRRRGPVEQVRAGRGAAGLVAAHRVRRRRLPLEVARAGTARRPPARAPTPPTRPSVDVAMAGHREIDPERGGRRRGRGGVPDGLRPWRWRWGARPGGWPRRCRCRRRAQRDADVVEAFEEAVLGRPRRAGTSTVSPRAGTSSDAALDVDGDLERGVGLDGVEQLPLDRLRAPRPARGRSWCSCCGRCRRSGARSRPRSRSPCSAHTACSRDEPMPKLGPATRIEAPRSARR